MIFNFDGFIFFLIGAFSKKKKLFPINLPFHLPNRPFWFQVRILFPSYFQLSVNILEYSESQLLVEI